MFIGITRAVAMLLKQREVLLIGDDFNGELSIHLEPLGPLPPLPEPNPRVHVGIVSPTSDSAGLIEGHYIILGGVDEVRINGGEVEERNAGFGEKNETLVGDIKKGIGK
jgi:hypothetical protein